MGVEIHPCDVKKDFDEGNFVYDVDAQAIWRA